MRVSSRVVAACSCSRGGPGGGSQDDSPHASRVAALHGPFGSTSAGGQILPHASACCHVLGLQGSPTGRMKSPSGTEWRMLAAPLRLSRFCSWVLLCLAKPELWGGGSARVTYVLEQCIHPKLLTTGQSLDFRLKAFIPVSLSSLQSYRASPFQILTSSLPSFSITKAVGCCLPAMYTEVSGESPQDLHSCRERHCSI